MQHPASQEGIGGGSQGSRAHYVSANPLRHSRCILGAPLLSRVQTSTGPAESWRTVAPKFCQGAHRPQRGKPKVPGPPREEQSEPPISSSRDPKKNCHESQREDSKCQFTQDTPKSVHPDYLKVTHTMRYVFLIFSYVYKSDICTTWHINLGLPRWH